MSREYHGEESVIENRKRQWLEALLCMIKAIDPLLTDDGTNKLLSQLGVKSAETMKVADLYNLKTNARDGNRDYSVESDSDFLKLSVQAVKPQVLDATTATSTTSAAAIASTEPVASETPSRNQPNSPSVVTGSDNGGQAQVPDGAKRYENQFLTFDIPAGLFGDNSAGEKDKMLLESTDGAVIYTQPSQQLSGMSPASAMEADIAATPSLKVTMKRSGPNWFAYSGYHGDKIFDSKTVFGNAHPVTFIIEHKKSDLRSTRRPQKCLLAPLSLSEAEHKFDWYSSARRSEIDHWFSGATVSMRHLM